MDGVRDFLADIKEHGQARGNFLGLLHVVIGRRIQKSDGTLVSAGLSWRDLAALLKKIRWDPEAVRELGLDPRQLPPRDRQRYWYSAITLARVDSPEARAAADRLAATLQPAGYVIGPTPTVQGSK